eukprot:SAG31_NODE_2719_length_5189_cov_4.394029_1_plen_109_part_00
MVAGSTPGHTSFTIFRSSLSAVLVEMQQVCRSGQPKLQKSGTSAGFSSGDKGSNSSERRNHAPKEKTSSFSIGKGKSTAPWSLRTFNLGLRTTRVSPSSESLGHAQVR